MGKAKMKCYTLRTQLFNKMDSNFIELNIKEGILHNFNKVFHFPNDAFVDYSLIFQPNPFFEKLYFCNGSEFMSDDLYNYFNDFFKNVDEEIIYITDEVRLTNFVLLFDKLPTSEQIFNLANTNDYYIGLHGGGWIIGSSLTWGIFTALDFSVLAFTYLKEYHPMVSNTDKYHLELLSQEQIHDRVTKGKF